MKRCFGLGILLVIFLIGIIPNTYAIPFFGEDKSFDVDNALLKVIIKESKNSSKLLELTSYEDSEFLIKKNNLDFVEIVESEFFLKNEERKDIEVIFEGKGKDTGIYFGEMIVLDGKESRIPVIMEIESEDVLFDGNINVPLDYINVYSGENMVVENKIFNLENIGLQNVEVSYFVKSFDGKTIFSDVENVAIESQLLNSKVVSIPEDTEEGNYIFGSVVRYKNSVGTSTYFFRVNKKTSYNFGENFFMWFVIFLLIGLIFFIIYYTKKRDDVLIDLQKDFKREIEKNTQAIKKEEDKVKKRAKGRKKKNLLKKLQKKRTKNIQAVKKIYRTRVKVVKVLRKAKKESEVSKKLKEWKKAGYNIEEMTGERNSVDKINKYKKEGYDL